MNALSLNDNWSVEYFDPDVDGFEMAPSPESIEHLPNWEPSARFVTAGFYAYLRRYFEVEATEYCVRYLLAIEAALPGARVYVNDQQVLVCYANSERVDITDYISLGRNKINLRIDCGQSLSHAVGTVSLLQTACD